MRPEEPATDFYCPFPIAFNKVSINRRYPYNILRKLRTSVLAIVMALFGMSSFVFADGEVIPPADPAATLMAQEPAMTGDQAQAAQRSDKSQLDWIGELQRAVQRAQSVQAAVNAPVAPQQPAEAVPQETASGETPISDLEPAVEEPAVTQRRLTPRELIERTVARRLIRKYLTDGIKSIAETVVTQMDEGLTAFFQWLNGITEGDTP